MKMYSQWPSLHSEENMRDWNVFIFEQEITKLNEESSQSKELKKEQNEPKESRRRELIQIK